MVGLIYPEDQPPDYDAAHEGGYFPAHIESTCDPGVARWLESVLQLVPVNQRPEATILWRQEPGSGMGPAPRPNRQRLLAAILRRDLRALADSMNACMECWKPFCRTPSGTRKSPFD